MVRRDPWDDDRESERRRLAPRDDFGQADYSRDYAYDPRNRTAYRVEDDLRRDDDFGQADYSRDYAYDPRSRSALRDPRAAGDEYVTDDERRRWRADRETRLERADDWRERRLGRDPDDRFDDRDRRGESRSWMDRAGENVAAFFGGRETVRRDRDYDVEREPDRERDRREETRRARERDRSDSVIYAVVTSRLDNERGLDARDIHVAVHDGEVTLNGTVRRRDDKRRAEDLAEVRGVSNVQNNLRLRERRFF